MRFRACIANALTGEGFDTLHSNRVLISAPIPYFYVGMVTVTNKADPLRKTKPKGRHPNKALSAVGLLRAYGTAGKTRGRQRVPFVQPSGTRSWIQRLVIRGRRRELGLGSVALVSLTEAREKARANRKLAREGGDPLAEKRVDRA